MQMDTSPVGMGSPCDGIRVPPNEVFTILEAQRPPPVKMTKCLLCDFRCAQMSTLTKHVADQHGVNTPSSSNTPSTAAQDQPPVVELTETSRSLVDVDTEQNPERNADLPPVPTTKEKHQPIVPDSLTDGSAMTLCPGPEVGSNPEPDTVDETPARRDTSMTSAEMDSESTAVSDGSAVSDPVSEESGAPKGDESGGVSASMKSWAVHAATPAGALEQLMKLGVVGSNVRIVIDIASPPYYPENGTCPPPLPMTITQISPRPDQPLLSSSSIPPTSTQCPSSSTIPTASVGKSPNGNSTGFFGVERRGANHVSYRACFKYKNKRYSAGAFTTPESAALAVDQMRLKLGLQPRNFPDQDHEKLARAIPQRNHHSSRHSPTCWNHDSKGAEPLSSVNPRRAGRVGTSKYRGVVHRQRKHSLRYEAWVYRGNVTSYIGIFSTELEAARAHDRRCRELGYMNCLNFPDDTTGDISAISAIPALSEFDEIVIQDERDSDSDQNSSSSQSIISRAHEYIPECLRSSGGPQSNDLVEEVDVIEDISFTSGISPEKSPPSGNALPQLQALPFPPESDEMGAENQAEPRERMSHTTSGNRIQLDVNERDSHKHRYLKTGFVGICLRIRSSFNSYEVTINHRGKKHYVGTFHDIQSALEARQAKCCEFGLPLTFDDHPEPGIHLHSVSQQTREHRQTKRRRTEAMTGAGTFEMEHGDLHAASIIKEKLSNSQRSDDLDCSHPPASYVSHPPMLDAGADSRHAYPSKGTL